MVFFLSPCERMAFSCIIKSKHLGNLGCDSMKKRKIFDIEKIGFGDENKAKAPLEPKPILKKESPVAIQPIRETRVKPVVNRPSAVLSPEVTLTTERPTSAKSQTNTSRINTLNNAKSSGYKPVEFVSPISGRRVSQPKRVHLAHGQYELATASLVDDKEKKQLIEEVEIQMISKAVAEEAISILNDDLHELFDKEDEVQVCPSSTTTNDAKQLEPNETASHRSSSDEEENVLIVSDESEKEGETSSVMQGLSQSNDKTLNVSQEMLSEDQDIEVVENTNLEEVHQIVESQVDEIQTHEEVSIHTIDLNLSNDTETELEEMAEQRQEEVDSSKSEIIIEENQKPKLLNEEELEIDDVLALLDEEENTPSIFQSLLEESTVKSQPMNLEIDDVISLLEQEEKEISILDQILAQSQIEESSSILTDEGPDEELSGEGLTEFDDENFCGEVLEHIQIEEESKSVYYETPNLSLLKEPSHPEISDEEWIVTKMEILEQAFHDFGVKVRLTGEYTQGPTVTLIEVQPESGTKLNKITSLAEDLKLSLSVEELRIEPIAGKNTIGIEIPNLNRKMVFLKEILSTSEFMLHESPLCIGLGQDISGQPVYADISTMPHGLIAGQTGSGKSVCINTLLVSMLYKASPEEVRVMLIDPKRVELAPYNAIPHLITPVISDERKAAQGLKWAVDEMERRYELFATNGVRDIKSFNERRHEFEMSYAKLPYILIVIDELADLMMVSAQEVEDCIMRITQKARAAGIHLIVATQRPTVDVITGTIKSNIPSRIAFAVAQANDSRVILDENGAQNLLGKGDMLWSSSGSKVKRVQGAYISTDEIDAIVDFVKKQGKPKYLISDEIFQKGNTSFQSDTDPLLYDAMNFIFDRGYATVSSLQTRLRIGFNRAARIIETLEMSGWIGEPQGAQKQREIKISREEFEAIKDETRF